MTVPAPRPCRVCHVEIPAPDPAGLAAFYARVFGWTTEPMGPDYVLFRDGTGGGGFDGSAKVCEGGPVLVMGVADIDAKLREIEAAGGRTLQGKTAIGDGRGFYAYFRDPAGNRMGIASGP
jgi:hypothetical protein